MKQTFRCTAIATANNQVFQTVVIASSIHIAANMASNIFNHEINGQYLIQSIVQIN